MLELMDLEELVSEWRLNLNWATRIRDLPSSEFSC